MRVTKPGIAWIAALTLASCAAEPTGPPIAQAKPGDPALTGKDYLLSEPDFRAVLTVARVKLAILSPLRHISRVNVISSGKVEAWFEGDDALLHYLLVERLRGEWRVISV